MKIDVREITGAAPRLSPIVIKRGVPVTLTIECPPPHKWLLMPAAAEQLLNELLCSGSVVDRLDNGGTIFSIVESYQVSNFIAHGMYYSDDSEVAGEKCSDAIVIAKRWVAALKDLSCELLKQAKRRKVPGAIDASIKAIIALNQVDLGDRLMSGRCVAEAFNCISDVGAEFFLRKHQPAEDGTKYEISQDFAAKAIGISVRELQRWEKGTVECPVEGYSKILRKDKAAFFDWIKTYKSNVLLRREHARGDVICDIR